MNVAEMEAIIGGYHGDAFSVLGPHPVNSPKGAETHVGGPGLSPAGQATSICCRRRRNAHGKAPSGRLLRRGTQPANPACTSSASKTGTATSASLEDPFRFGTIITDFDLHLHSEGTLYEAWKSFGSHPMDLDGVAGVRFAVWAPNAEFVSVAGDFNDWDTRRHPMRRRNSGVWEIFLPDAQRRPVLQVPGALEAPRPSATQGRPLRRSAREVPPKSASIICYLEDYEWQDAAWMKKRAERSRSKQPMSIYEVHLESWMRGPEGSRSPIANWPCGWWNM